jgi:hypothetical protein
MNLSEKEVSLFYETWYCLLKAVDEKYKITDKEMITATNEMPLLVPAHIMFIRFFMWDNPDSIKAILISNKTKIAKQVRPIIVNWYHHFVKDEFVVIDHQPNYSVFLSLTEPNKAYGVHGITDSIEITCPFPIPFEVSAVLLPFNNRIIYDSFLLKSEETLSRERIDLFKVKYKKAVDNFGIIEVLDGKN